MTRALQSKPRKKRKPKPVSQAGVLLAAGNVLAGAFEFFEHLEAGRTVQDAGKRAAEGVKQRAKALESVARGVGDTSVEATEERKQ